MKRVIQYLFSVVVSSLLLVSCDDSEMPEEAEGGKKKVSKELLDPDRAFNTTFDGKLFSVPSPIQTALLIKSADLNYNEKLLNPVSNQSNYTESNSKALNLGIYGADLGYVTLYDQNAQAMNYLNAVESLSNDLGMGGAFDADFLTRFENNSSNEDSMLVILTDAFRKGDNFLKENERKNVSALILTGGWLESIYFATNLYEKSGNKDILTRIGEQKQSLETILEILNEYNKDGQNDDIIEMLDELADTYQGVQLNYVFKNSETDKERKITTINSEMEISFEEGVKEKIIELVNEIRSSIIA